MFENENSKLITLAVASTLVGSFAAGSVAQADTGVRPFAMTTLSAGYLLGAGGEGTCGGDKEGETKDAEGSCGGDKDGEAKEAEGSCGGDKDGEAKEAEGSCGGDKEGEAKEDTEGKCGEGKCGSS